MKAELYTIDEGVLRLNFHPGQIRAWDSTARIIAMIAGSQGGKTSFGPWWLWREIQGCGAGDYLAGTASYDLFKLRMLPSIREVFEHVLNIGRYWSGDKVLELRDPETGEFLAKRADDEMWARIILRSASSTGGLESATAKAGWFDEAGQDEVPVTAYDAFRRRLALMRGRLLLTTTPYNLGWIKQQIIDLAGQHGIELINFESRANPTFSQEEWDELEATMPKWKFDMFYRGLLSRPPGMIYGDFVDRYKEEGGHKFRPFKIPQVWPRYMGVDPGGVNYAKLWFAHDTEADHYFLYRESLDGGKATAEHAKESVALEKVDNERVVMRYIGQKAESQIRLDWQAAGVSNVMEPPFHEVESGIDKVIALFKQHRLFISDECKMTLDQIGRYSRKIDGMGNVTEEIKDKQTYHFCDALRYFAAGRSYPVADWEAVYA